MSGITCITPQNSVYLQVGFVRYIEIKIYRGFIFDRENILSSDPKKMTLKGDEGERSAPTSIFGVSITLCCWRLTPGSPGDILKTLEKRF